MYRGSGTVNVNDVTRALQREAYSYSVETVNHFRSSKHLCRTAQYSYYYVEDALHANKLSDIFESKWADVIIVKIQMNEIITSQNSPAR